MIHFFRAPVLLLASLSFSFAGAATPAHDDKQGAGHHQPRQHGVVSLDVYRDDAMLHVLTVEAHATGDVRRLFYRQSADGGRRWTPQARVLDDAVPIYELTRGNDAQIAASGQRVVAAWTAKGNGYAGSGPLMTAISMNGGKTWQPGGNPADDGTTSGHAYVELIATKGVFEAVWLDGRDGAQGLRHARSRDGVRWEKNTTVQSKTCECCWQSLLQRDDALLVLFRGNTPRDMVLSALPVRPRSTAAWRSRGPVGKFDWDFKGCPHTGGGLAAGVNTRTLHAVVWTGANAALGLHHVISRDDGVTWNPLRRLGTPDAQRADIAVMDDGKMLAAVWDQLEGSRRLIYAAYSRDEGGTWSAAQRLSADDVDAVYPRLIAVPRGFLALWTERAADGASVLRTAAFTPSLRGDR